MACSGPGKGCSCAGAPGGGMGPAPTREAGRAFEPFPRQTLVGDSSATMSYLSDIYEVTPWKTLTYWFQVYASLPNTHGPPVTAYLETSDALEGPWRELVAGGIDGSAPQVTVGAVSGLSRYFQVRMDIQALETTAVAFRVVARPK